MSISSRDMRPGAPSVKAKSIRSASLSLSSDETYSTYSRSDARISADKSANVGI